MRPLRLLLVPIWVLGLVSLVALWRAGFGPRCARRLVREVFIASQLAWFAIVSARIATAREVDANQPAPPGPRPA